MKVIAVIVWFQPTSECVNNILTYSRFVDDIIIIDNSASSNVKLIEKLPHAEYLCFMENKGIATALNTGHDQAITAGADWVLTMDQDSSFAPDQIKRLIKISTEQSLDDNIAIFSPCWQNNTSSSAIQECNSVITSGSLVRLSAYKIISGYNESLFIDEVDHEFCFRLKRAGYRILRINNVCIIHAIGELLTIKILFFQMSTLNHNHIRKYYMTRNRLYMRSYFPDFGLPYLKMIMVDLLRVVLIEENKCLKLKYMIKGAMDYFIGIDGKLRDS